MNDDLFDRLIRNTGACRALCHQNLLSSNVNFNTQNGVFLVNEETVDENTTAHENTLIIILETVKLLIHIKNYYLYATEVHVGITK